MTDTQYLSQVKKELQHIFKPRKEIVEKAESFIANIRESSDMIIGVHIRHGDYKTWRNGRHFYTIEEFHQFMLRLQQLYGNKKIAFFISSNANFSLESFEGCHCYRYGKEPSGDILDLYTLSLCDRIIGPWSTFSRWASFIGEIPLCFIKEKNQQFSEESFSIVTSFYSFANGDSTEDYWAKLI